MSTWRKAAPVRDRSAELGPSFLAVVAATISSIVAVIVYAAGISQEITGISAAIRWSGHARGAMSADVQLILGCALLVLPYTAWFFMILLERASVKVLPPLSAGTAIAIVFGLSCIYGGTAAVAQRSPVGGKTPGLTMMAPWLRATCLTQTNPRGVIEMIVCRPGGDADVVTVRVYGDVAALKDAWGRTAANPSSKVSTREFEEGPGEWHRDDQQAGHYAVYEVHGKAHLDWTDNKHMALVRAVSNDAGWGSLLAWWRHGAALP